MANERRAPNIRLAVTGAMVGNAEASGRFRYPMHKNPAIRLAVTTAMTATAQRSGKFRYPMHKKSSPTIHLAYNFHPSVGKSMKNPPPNIRLAHVPGAQGDNSLAGRNGVERVPIAPSLLVSFVYLDKFLATKHLYTYRDWVLDSGAFSAFQSGTKIDLKHYIETCKKLIKEDPFLTEVFSLDVIGDWRASLKNCEQMWKAGVAAIPCYHRGEPEDVLKGMAKDYPKIALGGVAMLRGNKKMEWAGQCFARVWPKRIHGFGFGSRDQVLALPWHSVDATSWEIGPCRFGRWNTYGKMSIRGSKQNLRDEVEFYLNLEKLAQHKWAKQMKELEATGPEIKLAVSGSGIGSRPI